MSVKSFRQVDASVNDSEVARNTASANGLQELIQTIPRAYQAVLGDYLTKKYRVTQKHANVQSTVSAYERHANEGSFPPLIRNSLKEPTLQFAKEFLGTSVGSTTPDSFKHEVQAARKAVLNAALRSKKAELRHLAGLIRPDVEDWKNLVGNVVTKIVQNCGGRIIPPQNGGPKLEGVPDSASSEFLAMLGACELYTYRVTALAHAAMDRAELQKLSKIKLKDATDTEMTDVSKEPAVRDIIREEMRSLKKELFQNNGKSGKSANGVTKKQKRSPPRAKKGSGNGRNNRKKSR